MPGHLEKRSKNSWTIVIDIGRDPATGKRKRIYRAFQGTKRDAEKEMARLIAEIEKGTYVEPAKLTFGEYLQRWLNDYKVRLSPTTQRRYQQILNLRVIPQLGMIPLQKLKPIHIKEFYRNLIEKGRLDKDTPLSQASLTYHHRVLHKALQCAVEDELLTHNIMDAVPLPKIQKSVEIDDDTDIDEKVKVLDNHQVDQMLKAAKQTPYYELLFLAVHTGLRRGELLGLRWKDIDFQAGTLSVRQTLAYTPEKGCFFKPPKNKNSRRTIKITQPPEVIQILKQHRKNQIELRLMYEKKYEDHDLVFCQPNGKPIHPDTLSSWFPDFMVRIGLPKLNFHCLRHTHASLMLKAGADMKVVSVRLGHSSIRITYDLYSHLIPGVEDAILNKYGKLF